MTVNAGLSREKPLPGKAKRDLFSVEVYTFFRCFFYILFIVLYTLLTFAII